MQRRLMVPGLEGVFRVLPGHHFHSRPELFFQVCGETIFQFPEEERRLRAGQCCVVPRGLPHAEAVVRGRGGFFNVVVAFSPGVMLAHMGVEGSGGWPVATEHRAVEHPEVDRVVECLNDWSEARLDGPARLAAWRLAVGWMLRMAEGGPPEVKGRHSVKVEHCRALVRTKLQNPNLSVETLAGILGWHADYLSHRFHVETGEKLGHYILRCRLERACRLLERTPLGSAEVAYAVGFRHPGYFIRCFRAAFQTTPRRYRERYAIPGGSQKYDLKGKRPS